MSQKLIKRGHILPWKPPNNFITCDPGTKSFWHSHFKKGKLRGVHHLKAADYSLPDGLVEERIEDLRSEFDYIIYTTKAKYVLIERFVPRFNVGFVERLNLIIGVIVADALNHGISVDMMMASSWKNSLRSIGDYKKLVVAAKELKIPQHVVDTVCTARYLLSGYQYNPEDKAWIVNQLKGVNINKAILK